MLNDLNQFDLKKNYFQFFDLSIQYSLSLTELEAVYLNKQRLYHPDRYQDMSEKLRATQISAWINDAYNTLQAPVLRATYLLKLKGFTFDIESITVRDSNFLMQQMDLKETLEHYKQHRNNEEEINQLLIQTEQEFKQYMIDFEQYLKKSPAQLTEAFEALKKIYFLDKWIQSVKYEQV